MSRPNRQGDALDRRSFLQLSGGLGVSMSAFLGQTQFLANSLHANPPQPRRERRPKMFNASLSGHKAERAITTRSIQSR